MSDVWSVITGISALVAAGAATFAAIFTREIMHAGQKQVEVSQAQTQQAIEAEHGTQLPVLIPIKPLASFGFTQSGQYGQNATPRHNGYDPAMPFALVVLKNAGPGIAFNLRGVVWEPEPTSSVEKVPGRFHSHVYQVPISPGEELDRQWKDVSPPIGGDTLIGTTARYKLYAPRKPTPTELEHGAVEMVARLTCTYSDVFGRKHAAIYDCTAQDTWQLVDYLPDLQHDLADLEREALAQMRSNIIQATKSVLTSPAEE